MGSNRRQGGDKASMFFPDAVIRSGPMELIEAPALEQLINRELDDCDLTRGLQITVWQTAVVFEDGNNWMSYIEPRPESRDSYKPSPEAKKMIQKLLGDMRLKYNLK